MSNTEHKK